MAPDGLDDLEAEAEERKRRGRKSRDPGGSRNPRTAPSPEEDQAKLLAEREAERQRREAERKAAAEEAARKAAEEEAARKAAEEEAARKAAEEQERRDEEERQRREAESLLAKTKRPPSIPFYYDQENMDFLWRIADAATARREKVPNAAVLRLALRRLEEQLTPSEIVQMLSGPVQTEGKRGRPRR